MQLSQIPSLVPLPFAANGTKNTIPVASQIGITAGAASLNDGFPPLTFTPLAAGGVPPSGADFNGILNLLSANTQWANAGGFYEFNSSFASSIGGYPKSAILAKASGQGYWLNLEDDNSNDPDTGGAGWLSFDPWAIQSASYFTAKDTGAANAYAVTLTPAPSALTPGMLVNVQLIANTNTGASTLAVNGLSMLPILHGKGTALTGGELVAGYGAILRLNNAGTAWELVWTGAANPSGVKVLAPTASTSITPSYMTTIVQPNITAAATITIEPGTVVGQRVRVYGGGYVVTVQTNVTSGSPSLALPDGTFVFSWVIPAGEYSDYIECVWDGVNWRCTTAGLMIVAPATQNNAAAQLSQLFIGNRKAVFTANGTWTVPSYVTQIWVSGCAGGGGGGCGADAVTGGNGGGAGQSVIKTPVAVTGGHSLSITIGSGGAAGAAGNYIGVAGGNTVLTDTTAATTLLTLSGGPGGGIGGAGSGATNWLNSASGGYPAGGNGAIVNGFSIGGSGGSGPFGGGGATSIGRGQGSAQNGSGYGSGGGGGCGNDAGGSGASGILIIEW